MIDKLFLLLMFMPAALLTVLTALLLRTPQEHVRGFPMVPSEKRR